MKTTSIVLIIVGVLSLSYQGLFPDKRAVVMHTDPMPLTLYAGTRSSPVPLIMGGLCIAVGIGVASFYRWHHA